MSDWTKELWEVTHQSQLDHSINHCTLASVITYKQSADLYGTFYVHQRIADTKEGYHEGKQRIARMVSTHNACLLFPNPEADMKALVGAATLALQTMEHPYNGYGQACERLRNILARLRREP